MFFVTSQIKHKRHFEGITAHTKAPFLFCICLHKKRSYPSRIPAFFAEKGFSGYRSQFELITAVGGSADGVSRFHLPAELTDDIDYVRAAALRKLVPYSLVDLFLREEPARVLGQVSQCKELQMREIQGPHFTVCLRRWSSIPRKARVGFVVRRFVPPPLALRRSGAGKSPCP